MKREKNKVLSKLLNIRIVAVVGVLVLAISYLSFSGESKFKDVGQNHWASKEIDFLTDKQIIFGYKDGTFKPNNSITRLQAVMMILREKGVTNTTESIIDPGFADMKPGQTGYADVAKAVELGIIDGMVNDKGQRVFKPQGTLTRAQMAKILALGYDLTGTSNTSFTDVPKTHWSYTYIQALAKNGITAGYSNGRFGAGESLTRAQFASMMARLLDKSFVVTPPVSKPNEPSKPSKPETGGSTYPDGWKAPTLKSKWSSNHEVNVKTLQNELGFKKDGLVYGIPEYPQGIIHIAGQGGKAVDITFFSWEEPAFPNAYRIPIVSKELFKLYFDKDADRVWNYFNKNDIPDNFTANGFKVKATYSSSTGGITLSLR